MTRQQLQQRTREVAASPPCECHGFKGGDSELRGDVWHFRCAGCGHCLECEIGDGEIDGPVGGEVAVCLACAEIVEAWAREQLN